MSISAFKESNPVVNQFKSAEYGQPYVNVIGIDTQEIDAFRQGVEITSYRSNVLGIYKIRVSTVDQSYGQGGNQPFDTAFSDEVTLPDQIMSKRIDVQYGDQNVFSQTLNGVIEPLAIRKLIYATGITYPRDANEIRGHLMAGNITQLKGSDSVQDTQEFNSSINYHAGFLDNFIDDLGQLRPQTFYEIESQKVSSFNECFPVNPTEIGQQNFKNLLSGSIRIAGTRLGSHEISATCGFVYDDVSGVGTDSIAFGGLRY